MRNYLIALTVIILVFTSIIGLFHDTTGSMDDTLLAGDTFIVLNFWYGFRLPLMDTPLVKLFAPKPDDIIVFRAPLDEHQILVKRCIAVGGQTVEIIQKMLVVDGEPVPLPLMGKHADPDTIPMGDSGRSRRDFRPVVTVPDSAVYVLGDNRDYSVDSRFWGVLPKENIRGKVWFTLWSIDPEVPITDPIHKIRWGRFFHRVY